VVLIGYTRRQKYHHMFFKSRHGRTDENEGVAGDTMLGLWWQRR